MGGDDQLARKLAPPQQVDDDLVDVLIVQIVFRLVDDQGLLPSRQQQAQDRRAALAHRAGLDRLEGSVCRPHLCRHGVFREEPLHLIDPDSVASLPRPPISVLRHGLNAIVTPSKKSVRRTTSRAILG